MSISCANRIFPWGCASGFLRRIVPDAAPAHGLLNGIPHIQRQLTEERLLKNKVEANCGSDENTILSDGTNNNSLNNLNNNKSASLLIKRLPSIGERVL